MALAKRTVDGLCREGFAYSFKIDPETYSIIVPADNGMDMVFYNGFADREEFNKVFEIIEL
jgi:hypothetical protein